MTAFRILTLSAMLVSSLALAACDNTVRGAGEDIERAGAAIQKSTK